MGLKLGVAASDAGFVKNHMDGWTGVLVRTTSNFRTRRGFSNASSSMIKNKAGDRQKLVTWLFAFVSALQIPAV
jgi:hypothetical protein